MEGQMVGFSVESRALEVSGRKVLVFAVSGSVDAPAVKDLDNALAAALRDGAKCLVLDMSRMDYISSAGLRLLLRFRKTASEAGGVLKVAALHREIRQNVFDALGFSRLIEVYGTVEEAVQSVSTDDKTTAV